MRYSIMTTLVDRLDAGFPGSHAVLDWGCPVPFFGNIDKARVATVGLNPSNREFVDLSGQELAGQQRRLPTLTSLGVDGWRNVNSDHLREIAIACAGYFLRNPYDRWFGALDTLLVGLSASYYSECNPGVHLDLVPYATTTKWTALSTRDRRSLLETTRTDLGHLLAESKIEVIILNGQSVVRQFALAAELQLDEIAMPSWDLLRSDSATVRGAAYVGDLLSYSGVTLQRRVRVLGFNLNLQSSFGVTSAAKNAIAGWIAQQKSARQ